MYILKLQTMNTLKFLVCNINDTFPTDINEMIFKKVQENSAESIQKLYYLRVRINLDAFLILNRMSQRMGASPDEIHHFNKIIAFYATRIRYSYIQEPGIWIDTITDIINRCGHHRDFHVNNAHFIMNNVKISNPIFTRTGIAWWENL
jgi:hypothetical protein